MISKLPAATAPLNMLFCQKIRPPRSLPFVSSRGFTLIELSIVVVIISMLLSLGLGVLNAQLVSAAQAETKKRQAIIKDALIAYLGDNKRLPCPDVPNNTHGATDTSQVTGVEDRAGGLPPGEIPTGACSGNVGIVPYATLGLGRDVALDGWGNFMSYSIPAGDDDCANTGGSNWSRTGCFGAAKDSPYSLNEGTVGVSIQVADNVLAVVISHGPNGFAAWGRQGSRNVPPSRCEEAHNAIATEVCTLTPNHFYKGDRTDVDDVVVVLTRNEAINTLVKQGTLKSADGQVTDELGQLRSAWMDSLLINCSSSPPTMVVDPWGDDYIPTHDSWPYTICSSRGGEGATPYCAYIYKTEMISLGATCPPPPAPE